ncbi:hypothetical protein J5N97_018590 [Dioscorea zingiberensis]|uniref:Uncharacterized protein n=1 Tax=Dioscorea zingiberensis TaxID=325984 RepID=A0A9D5CCJ7_9LILI|nr:hypothetical protein J5N97_018590 [Dioscorea zingiberensis]
MMMRRPGGVSGGGVMRALRTVGAAKRSLPDAAGGSRSATPPRIGTSASGSSQGTSPPPSSSSSSGSVTGLRSYPCPHDGDWDIVDDLEAKDDDKSKFYNEYVFGLPPSVAEAEDAVSTIKQIFIPDRIAQVREDGTQSSDKESVVNDATNGSHSANSDSDWIEPTLQITSFNGLKVAGHPEIINAFHQLHANEALQRMVVSLSVDKAVWDAIMKNKVVKELKNSFSEADSVEPQNSDDHPCPDAPGGVLKWIVNNTKARIMEVFHKITELVGNLFHSHQKNLKGFDKELSASFMITVMALIIIVVNRIKKS